MLLVFANTYKPGKAQAVRWSDDFSRYGGADGRIMVMSDPEFSAKYSQINISGAGMDYPQFYPSRFVGRRMAQAYSTANQGQLWFRPRINALETLEFSMEYARYGVNGSSFTNEYNSQLAVYFVNALDPTSGISAYIDPFGNPSSFMLFAYVNGVVVQIASDANILFPRRWRDNQNIIQTMQLNYKDGVATAKVLSGGVVIADLTLNVPVGPARGPGVVEIYAVAEPGTGTEFHKINLGNGLSAGWSTRPGRRGVMASLRGIEDINKRIRR